MNATPGDVTIYRFRTAVGGFFEMPTDTAMRLLPEGMFPVEVRHGRSVLSVLAFDFVASPVGTYGELVVSVVVAPRVSEGARLPRAAFHPLQVGTTTAESRAHGIERWHLPHYASDIGLTLDSDERGTRVVARHGTPILEMSVTAHDWTAVDHLYQSSMVDATGRYLADITMTGEFSENEEERGSLTLHEHPFVAALRGADITPTPMRELWMRAGMQSFAPLRALADTAT